VSTDRTVSRSRTKCFLEHTDHAPYRNQALFVQVMTNILRSMIGFEKDQIGLASFHLMYGVRGANGIVEPGW